ASGSGSLVNSRAENVVRKASSSSMGSSFGAPILNAKRGYAPAMTAKPAVSLVAVAGRRRATLDLARRLEDEGFAGIYCPSPGDGLALCEALALTTRALPFGTSIANIYTRHAFDYAQTAAVVHELSGGRFRFGIGVSHGPMHQRLGLKVGKPLEDVSKFVADVRAAAPQVGALPPLVLATLRRRMVE